MIYSTTTHTIQNILSLEDTVRELARAGFPAIDLSMCGDCSYILSDDYKESAAELRALADELGIVFNQAHAPFGPYEKYKGEMVPHMHRFVEFAGLIGAKVIVVHPIQRATHHYRYSEELFRENMEFYSSLAPTAKKFGVKIGIENMWQRRPVSNIIDDSACADPVEFNRYYDTLNDPEAFTVCLDVGHVVLCGRDPVDVIHALGSRIGALHVHDVDYVDDTHTLPGLGKIDWEGVCRALAEVGYNGDFTLEAVTFPSRYAADFMPSVLKFMNDVAAYYAARIQAYKSAM